MARLQKKKEKKAAKSAAHLDDFGVILSPVITEKTALVGGGEKSGVVFRVRMDATKTQIRETIERMFNVKVKTIGTCRYLGKKKRTTGASGKRVDFKKAYIRLQEGHKIEIIEGV